MEDRYDDIYRAVGQAILDFGPLEFMIHRVAWTGIDPRNETVGRGRTARLQVGAVLKLIENAVADGAYAQFVTGIDGRILEFATACRRISDHRGRLAHSYLDNGRVGRIRDAIARPGMPLLGLTVPFDLDGARSLPDEYFRLRDEGQAIWLAVDAAAEAGGRVPS